MSMHVCSPTHTFKNLAEIEAVVSRYKKLGGKLPPPLEAALAAAKTGQDIENHLNTICDETLKFYLEAEDRCAVEAGFKNVFDMEGQRATRWSDIEQKFDACNINVERQFQAKAVTDFFDIERNKELILKIFGNIKPLLLKYAKKKLLKDVKLPGGADSSAPSPSTPTSTRSPTISPLR